MEKQTYQTPVPIPCTFPAQHQNTQPGSESAMNPQPITDNPGYRGSSKLMGRVAVVSGGDSGIGLAVATAFAKEGADIAILHLSNDDDAKKAIEQIKSCGAQCMSVHCDLRQEAEAVRSVDAVLNRFGKINILVNNIAVQFPQNSIEDISAQQLSDTFSTNIYSYFFLTKACLPHLHQSDCIINTASVTAYEGKETLIDYSASKGAIVSFTRSMSRSLAKEGIRVNAVAPGPVWTPLIPSSFSPQDVEKFGQNTPLGRASQPFELAPTYVYLASDDAGYVTGQVLHVNGGTITES